MKHLFVLLLLMQVVFAAITITPATAVKVGDTVSVNVTYAITQTKWEVVNATSKCYHGSSPVEEMSCSELYTENARYNSYIDGVNEENVIVACTFGTQESFFSSDVNITTPAAGFNTTRYVQSYACTRVKALAVSSDYSPGGTIPYNITSAAYANPSQQHTGNIQIQNIGLALDNTSLATAGAFNLTGKFSWTDGSALSGKPVDISSSLCSTRVTTSTTGTFTAPCDYNDYVLTGVYAVNATAFYTLDKTATNTTNVSIAGATEAEVNITGTAFNATYGNNVTSVPVYWQLKQGNPVAVTLNAAMAGKTYTKACSTPVSQCNATYLVVVPTAPGLYTLNTWATWTDDRGVAFNVSKAVNITMLSSGDFVLDKTTLSQTMVVGETTTTSLKITALGNTKSVITFNNTPELSVLDALGVPVSSITLPEAVGDVAVTLRLSMPYNASAGATGELRMSNQFGVVRSISYALTPGLPNVFWEKTAIPVSVTQSQVQVPMKLTNLGENARGIALSVNCPEFWVCGFSTSSFDVLQKGSAADVTFSVNITAVAGLTQKVLTITATDAAGRLAKSDITLTIDPISTVLVGEQMVATKVAFTEEPRYYVVGKTELTAVTSTASTEELEARVKRNTDLSSWTVHAEADSIGLGDVCDVYIYTGNKSYRVDPDPSTPATLAGGVGQLAYEYLVFHRIGTCRAHITYGEDVDTITFVEVQGAASPATALVTKDEISQQVAAGLDEWMGPVSDILQGAMLIFLLMACIYAYQVMHLKRRGVQVTKQKKSTIVLQGNVQSIHEKGKVDHHMDIKTRVKHLLEPEKLKSEELASKPFGKFMNTMRTGKPGAKAVSKPQDTSSNPVSEPRDLASLLGLGAKR